MRRTITVGFSEGVPKLHCSWQKVGCSTDGLPQKSRFELVDAERASEKIRQILGKIRKLKDGKERLSVMKVAIGFALNSLYVLSEVIRECKLIVSERYFLRDVRDYDLMTSL